MSNIFPERQRVPMGTMLCPAMRGTFTAIVNSNTLKTIHGCRTAKIKKLFGSR